MAVDERAMRTITEAIAALDFKGNEEGLVPAFGLYLAIHCADYYNRISYGILGAFRRELPELEEDAIALLTEAGQVCAFNTYGGIMMSVEWDAVVRPMLSCREDWVHGMIGVLNALGWGRWRVASLSPGERVAIEIHDSYEAAGYLEAYPRADSPRCFLAAGGVAGLMNLLYQADITARPVLTEALYHEVFRHPRSFRAREVRCVAMGDPVCEIVAERQSG